MKQTLILGATDNPDRYAYKAAQSLVTHGHPIIPIGIRKGMVQGQVISNSKEIKKDVDTITLYIGAANQKEWYNYVIDTKPKRLIFNPGAENEELKNLAEQNGIEAIEGCTLVMLSIGNY